MLNAEIKEDWKPYYVRRSYVLINPTTCTRKYERSEFLFNINIGEFIFDELHQLKAETKTIREGPSRAPR